MTTPSPAKGPDQNPAQLKFDSALPHHAKPRLRAVRAFPVQTGEDGKQVMMGVADARQISDKMVVVPPAFQLVFPLLDGTKSLDEIVGAVGRGLTREPVEQLVAQLDSAGLLFGPVFEALRDKMKQDFDSQPNLPPSSTAAFADMLAKQALGDKAAQPQIDEVGPTKLRELMDQWMSQALEKAEKPSFDQLPRAIVAPHIDYPRGWMNYANVWGRMRVVDRPDRVVILGTNHFGESTGVCACDKGFTTPLGVCEADGALLEALKTGLGPAMGEALLANRYDHEHEHSIELQIPWIQHCLGADDKGEFPKVLGILVHDPAANNGDSYDGQGVGFQPFVDALRGAIEKMPGKTLIVSSADLSHVGPAFGDEQALAGDAKEAEEARNKVFGHDREMLGMLLQMKADDLVASLAWQQNPTRWCSTGNMVAAVKIAQPQRIELLNYAAAMDQQGLGMVSSAAMAMF